MEGVGAVKYPGNVNKAIHLGRLSVDEIKGLIKLGYLLWSRYPWLRPLEVQYFTIIGVNKDYLTVMAHHAPNNTEKWSYDNLKWFYYQKKNNGFMKALMKWKEINGK